MSEELKSGDFVVKKSGKPFPNGHKKAEILGYGMMNVGEHWHKSAVLCGMVDMVQLRMLKKAPSGGSGSDSTKVR